MHSDFSLNNTTYNLSRIQVAVILFDGLLPYVRSHIYQEYSKNMDQPGKVASPARGQLNRKNEYFPVRVRA